MLVIFIKNRPIHVNKMPIGSVGGKAFALSPDFGDVLVRKKLRACFIQILDFRNLLFLSFWKRMSGLTNRYST